MSVAASMMVGNGEAERAADGFPRGLAFGRVTDNRDPEGLGRVRVKLELHSDDQASFWARIATPMAGPEIGAWFLPEIDDEVLVGFIGEDASHPVVLGGVWNSQQPPPETNSDGNNDRRLIRSRSAGADVSAVTNASGSAYRSSWSCASAFTRARSTGGGSESSCSRSSADAPVIRPVCSASGFSQRPGGRPTNISYNTHAREYTSVRPSSARLPAACSGLI